MQSTYTYATLGFSDQEKQKIEKRMDKEFIEEYIKYIQARNEFNTTKHTTEELKQKVLDYAVHANVDPKDSEKLREQTQQLKEESDKIDKKREDDVHANMEYVARGRMTFAYSFPPSATKKVGKRLIYGKMHNLRDRKQIVETYNNDIITSHAILSLLERQPKYYTNYVMSKVNGHLQDSNTWFESDRKKNIKKYDKTGLIKNRARLMVFPQPDTDEGDEQYGNNNFHIIENEKVKRIAWIDLDDFLDQDWPSRIPSIKEDEIAVYMQEFNKFLCVTPNLIELSVKQHLMTIGVKDEKILKEQTMKALNHYSIALKTFASYKDMINGRDSEFKNDLNYVVWHWTGDTYYGRLKQAINATKEEDKKQFLKIVNNPSLKARLEKAIKDFDAYKNKLTTKTATNEKEKKSISEQIIPESYVDPDKIKQDIINAIAKRLGKTKTLYWNREGKYKKLMNTRFFLKENAGYINKINSKWDKLLDNKGMSYTEKLKNLQSFVEKLNEKEMSGCCPF